MKASARDFEEEDATATRTCWTSCTSRVAGLVRRSLVKVVAIPPVASIPKGLKVRE